MTTMDNVNAQQVEQFNEVLFDQAKATLTGQFTQWVLSRKGELEAQVAESRKWQRQNVHVAEAARLGLLRTGHGVTEHFAAQCARHLELEAELEIFEAGYYIAISPCPEKLLDFSYLTHRMLWERFTKAEGK